jgi:hypothetical protein
MLVRIALLFLVAAALPGIAAAKTLEVGEGKQYKTLQEAVTAASEGDKVLIAEGEYFECANIRGSNITIEGAGKDGSTILTDTACGGKALLIAGGDNITIRNLTLTRARVQDGNGAGIRAEGGNLTVERVKFINNQNGILAANSPDATMIVRDSEFTRNGVCNPSCAHGIYVGKLKLLRVENSKFTDTRQAHHIKSRASRLEVIGSTFIDGPNGTASYMIEAPNGGSLVVRNSTLEKGPKSENHTGAIVIGMEGVNQPTREIIIENNTFKNAGNYPTFFVVNQSATEAVLKGNKISGQAQPLRGDGEVH